MVPDPPQPPASAAGNLLSSTWLSAGWIGFLFWMPLMWAILHNRHSLQLTGDTLLLVTATLFVMPVLLLAVTDRVLEHLPGAVHRTWRIALFTFAVAWFLFINTHFENDTPVPGIALALSIGVALWLINGALARLRPGWPRWARLLAMLLACALFSAFLVKVPLGLATVPFIVTLLLVVGLARLLAGRVLETGNAVFEIAGMCTLVGSIAFIGAGYWSDHRSAQLRESAGQAAPFEGGRGPVFVFIFDGMSREALTDASGEILERFPTFRRLAREGRWIRDATTNFDHTSESIPSMLLGRFEQRYSLSDSPTLFDHLGSAYTGHVRGVVLDYCAALSGTAIETCTDQRHYFQSSGYTDLVPLLLRVFAGTLPSQLRPEAGTRSDSGVPIGLDQGKRASVWLLEDLLRQVREEPLANTLFFTHVLTPHAPFMLRPDGTVNDATTPRHFSRTATPGELAQALENYRLEIEYDNRFLARFIDLLERRGAWEETTLVVTADHGYAWEWDTRKWGTDNHRNLVTEQVARIPAFIKARRGMDLPHVASSYRPMDLIPTLLDLTGLAPLSGVRLDGHSVFAAGRDDGPLKVVSTTGEPWTFDPRSRQWRQGSPTTSPIEGVTVK